DRQPDAEALVYGKGDVEKIEAVDAKIVDRVRIRMDLRTIDPADIGNNPDDHVERALHSIPFQRNTSNVLGAESRHLAATAQSFCRGASDTLRRLAPRTAGEDANRESGPRLGRNRWRAKGDGRADQRRIVRDDDPRGNGRKVIGEAPLLFEAAAER